MNKQLHFDLETLGLEYNAKILSIGAVCGLATYYCEVDTSLYPEQGFSVSDSTVEWWEKRGGFQPSVEPKSPMACVSGLVRWMSDCTINLDYNEFEVWANSPTFDCDIMRNHLSYYGIKCPWMFWQERDVRTIKNLGIALHVRTNVPANPHHALEDAKNQQALVEQVYNELSQHCDNSRKSLQVIEVGANNV